MSEEESSIRSQVLAAFLGWGVPALFSAIPFLAWFDAARAVLKLMGWHTVTAILSILVFAICRLIYLLRRERKVAKELKADFHAYLEYVPGGGVYRDSRNGEIICPRCVADKNVPTPMYKVDLAFEGLTYVCGGCGNKVRCSY